MSDLISRKYLYDKMAEKEELARQRVLDTPTHSPAYHRYVAQLNERTALKHEIADAPTVEAVPVVHGEWERVGSGSLYDVYECTNCHCPPKWDCLGDNHWKIAFTDFCPHCGADMRKKV